MVFDNLSICFIDNRSIANTIAHVCLSIAKLHDKGFSHVFDFEHQLGIKNGERHKSNLDSLIDPAGWMPWSGSFALNTLYYGEYMNTGPGSSTKKRVNWKGYRVERLSCDR
ncbi:hypothetical protein R6Q59_030177 [Mikania micrantha]